MENGLSLVVIGDWYNEELMKQTSFMNNNTFEIWEPVMAGANVGSINALLEPYNIALGDKRVMTGDFVIDKRQVIIDSGSEIVQFPKDGYLISADLREEPLSKDTRNQSPSEGISTAIQPYKKLQVFNESDLVPTIGVLKQLDGLNSSGSIIVMTDSDCLDSSSVHYRDLYSEESVAQ